jgi:hypothetical protein
MCALTHLKTISIYKWPIKQFIYICTNLSFTWLRKNKNLVLSYLLGLADADEFVALAQEGRHALASVVGRHVERLSALQERKHIVGTLIWISRLFFS